MHAAPASDQWNDTRADRRHGVHAPVERGLMPYPASNLAPDQQRSLVAEQIDRSRIVGPEATYRLFFSQVSNGLDVGSPP